MFAHVPDIRDFAAGLRALVKDTGLVTLEFPHLLRLMQRRQFDTIYHEHYSYLSLLTAPGRWPRRGCVWSTSKSSTPMAARCASMPVLRSTPESPPSASTALLDEEDLAGLHTLAGHAGFARGGLEDQE